MHVKTVPPPKEAEVTISSRIISQCAVVIKSRRILFCIECFILCSYVNHAIYWSVMSPNPNKTERFPVGRLLDEIENTFGSYYAFKVEMSTAAVDLFGSGTQFVSPYLSAELLIF